MKNIMKGHRNENELNLWSESGMTSWTKNSRAKT